MATIVALSAADRTTQLSLALRGILASSTFVGPDRNTDLRDSLDTYYSTGPGTDATTLLRKYLDLVSP